MSPSTLTSGRLPPAEEALFERIATLLESGGLAVLPGALPSAVAEALSEGVARRGAAAWRDAGIGRGDDHANDHNRRRNRIAWIDEGDVSAAPWFEWTGNLRAYLNQRLFLGLFSFESHFTCYAPGDFYQRHLDAFRGQSNRVLSLVTFLNAGWLPGQGGELVVYPPEGSVAPVRVIPAFGTLVLFLSEVFPHEVLPATRTRIGVAGWFHVNSSLPGCITPPR